MGRATDRHSRHLRSRQVGPHQPRVLSRHIHTDTHTPTRVHAPACRQTGGDEWRTPPPRALHVIGVQALVGPVAGAAGRFTGLGRVLNSAGPP